MLSSRRKRPSADGPPARQSILVPTFLYWIDWNPAAPSFGEPIATGTGTSTPMRRIAGPPGPLSPALQVRVYGRLATFVSPWYLENTTWTLSGVGDTPRENSCASGDD